MAALVLCVDDLTWAEYGAYSCAFLEVLRPRRRRRRA